MLQRQPKRSDQEWLELIQKCRTSGQTDKDWCEQHGVAISTFYNKVSKLRKKACDIPSAAPRAVSMPGQVVRLEILEEEPPRCDNLSTEAISSSIPAVVLNLERYRVEISNHAAKEVILHTLSVLRQLC